MGFTELLTILFIGLKLAGFISWSWWLVFSPMLIVYSIIILLFLAAAITK
jgi:hypothetical protein